jgi:SAM-dependent methyltransferase
MNPPPEDPNITVPLPPLAAQDDDLSSEEADSGYGDETALSTASLQSSIFDYEEENGRSYHAFRRGKYVMPNDEREQERMDMHYHSLRLALNNRHWIAPITSPRNILDVGTGTGIWAMDVADDYPTTQITGIDLSPIQPTAVPPNLQFLIMDADEPWDGYEARFDYIHTRLMNGFSIKSWPHFYAQAFASLEPGGWVENQEFEVVFASDDSSLDHPLGNPLERRHHQLRPDRTLLSTRHESANGRSRLCERDVEILPHAGRALAQRQGFAAVWASQPDRSIGWD